MERLEKERSKKSQKMSFMSETKLEFCHIYAVGFCSNEFSIPFFKQFFRLSGMFIPIQ
jgi:hypothetical protein